MPLTILSDSDVQTLLHNLTRDDIINLQQSLADALHYYSTADISEGNGCCSAYQPQRTSLRRKDGSTTLFMPASSSDGLGVKIVTLLEPEANLTAASSVSSLDISPLSISSSSPSPSAGSSTTAFDVPDDPPSVVPTASEGGRANTTCPRGSLTLLDATGAPRALVNAEEITAFRTALASTMLFKKRANVHDVTVFGAGKQAYWHIRLALILRGTDIHHLNIINRTFANAQSLMKRLFVDSVTNFGTAPLHHPKVQILTPIHNEYARLLKSTVRSSSVVFCTTPSTLPLFPASYLTHTEGRKKGRYIAAIGSYRPHMVEIHPDIVRQAVAPDHGRHFHKHARTGGAIIVDSVDACMREAGEIIQAGLSGREVVELGELVMLKRDAERRRQEAAAGGISSDLDISGVEVGGWMRKKSHSGSSRSSSNASEDKREEGLRDWLERGNVVYKSVGLGLMDVVVGGDLVKLADERSVGTRIQDF